MLDVETFLTTLYVVIDEFAKTQWPAPDLRCGRRRRLCLSEVLTLAVFGQWSGFASQRAFYRYAQRHLCDAFPGLPARSQLNRAIRAAEAALSQLGPYLAATLGTTTARYEVMDSTGLVVRDSRRRGRSWLAGQANLGRCTRVGWYYGLHALTCCTREGVITGSGLAPASTNDQRLAQTFFHARQAQPQRLRGVGRPAAGYYVADTGFDRPATPQFWPEQCGALVVSMPYRNQRRWPRARRRWLAGLRQIVESVHTKLLHTCGMARERPHTLGGIQARWAAAVALHNFCCWLNRQLGRALLAFADLLDW
jgi:hypothetical protein